MKVALVHDWLTGMRGGEKALEALCEIFPEAPLYTLFWIPGSVSKKIESHPIHTSFLQPLIRKGKNYRYLLPLMPCAAQSLKISPVDIVISSSHCAAKGVRLPPDAKHICYCFTPMRYIWNQYEEYFSSQRAGFGVRLAARLLRPALQRWDQKSSRQVDLFVAISRNVQDRIRRIYGRESELLYPPVETEAFHPEARRGDYYLAVSALSPYKRLDIAVEAFNRSGRSLKIVGTGPEEESLKKRARKNIQFLGWVSQEELAGLYARAKALIFPGEEDFGIAPVEALASGAPVVAYGKGGVLETVVDGKTGILFSKPTAPALEDAVKRSDSISWDAHALRAAARPFERKRFVEGFKNILKNMIE